MQYRPRCLGITDLSTHTTRSIISSIPRFRNYHKHNQPLRLHSNALLFRRFSFHPCVPPAASWSNNLIDSANVSLEAPMLANAVTLAVSAPKGPLKKEESKRERTKERKKERYRAKKRRKGKRKENKKVNRACPLQRQPWPRTPS